MARYKAVVVDDSKDMCNAIVERLQEVGISTLAYSTAEELYANLFGKAVLDPAEMPDLLVIDLKLDSPTQGMELIHKLADRNVPSTIMAISGEIPSTEFLDDVLLFGAAVMLPKPFLMKEFCRRAINLAVIGNARRLRRMEALGASVELLDNSRRHRPLFISYADEERQVANGIRIHMESIGIDVWYAPTALDIGQEWRHEIERGVDDAFVFIPILSDNFLKSAICKSELKRFRWRMERDREPNLLLLPVLYDLTEFGAQQKVFKAVERRYHWSPLRPRVSDCLTALISRVERHLEGLQKRRVHQSHATARKAKRSRA